MLGRLNAEGFLGYWSAVAGDEAACSRDRGYADRLVGAEKVVFSRMLTEAPWERTRIANGSVMDVVSDLKASGEGDILVNSSASLIKSLLSADMIDRPYLLICLEIAGGGARLFEARRGALRTRRRVSGARSRSFMTGSAERGASRVAARQTRRSTMATG
ncbi:dihydrofolate reductase family protein [Ensifer adhaerens]|uniref:dihydrofolate reductase family protein n=1 Tax=Ensifer adhaerens TaxID=106592 RepID=UPI000DC20179|nr:dihydrofolate reductase family protein [Ensifer adhaerens]RAS10461.1 RibD domain-containing protein [Ensifer adhaerens]